MAKTAKTLNSDFPFIFLSFSEIWNARFRAKYPAINQGNSHKPDKFPPQAALIGGRNTADNAYLQGIFSDSVKKKN
ncbi:MAG: hypothetical protein EDM79_08930 [Chloroflexi bacterium]|nr:MAG: hypothetical protein EDM79_08930 [Chloroflexota bacterium]MCE7858582.1 hypothetical protein [Chloroflexi bacterium CFX2]